MNALVRPHTPAPLHAGPPNKTRRHRASRDSGARKPAPDHRPLPVSHLRRVEQPLPLPQRPLPPHPPWLAMPRLPPSLHVPRDPYHSHPHRVGHHLPVRANPQHAPHQWDRPLAAHHLLVSLPTSGALGESGSARPATQAPRLHDQPPTRPRAVPPRLSAGPLESRPLVLSEEPDVPLQLLDYVSPHRVPPLVGSTLPPINSPLSVPGHSQAG